METKSPKPSRADLLKELESIRESLLSEGSDTPEASATGETSTAKNDSAGAAHMSNKKTEAPQPEKPHSLMKKSFLEIDESDYDYELKIPAHATQSQTVSDTEENDTAREETEGEAEEILEEQIEINLASSEEETNIDEDIDVDNAELEDTKIELAAPEETVLENASHEDISAEEDSDDIAELAHMLSHEDDEEEHNASPEPIANAITRENDAITEQDIIAAQTEEPEELQELEATHEQEEDIATLDQPLSASETPTIEVPAISDMLLAQHAVTDKAGPKPLPGQQSLFDDNIIPQQIAPQQVAPQQAVPQSSAAAPKLEPKLEKAPPLKAAATKPLVENPFLPAHIKAKLERERSLYEQEINAAVQTNSARYFPKPVPGPVGSVTPKTEKAPRSEHEALIDEIVKEYLPKIEAKLRERLRECLAEANEE